MNRIVSRVQFMTKFHLGDYYAKRKHFHATWGRPIVYFSLPNKKGLIVSILLCSLVSQSSICETNGQAGNTRNLKSYTRKGAYGRQFRLITPTTRPRGRTTSLRADFPLLI